MEVGGQRSANDSYLLCKWRRGGPGNHLVSLSHTTWGKHCHISYQPSTLFLINLLMMKGKQFIRDKKRQLRSHKFLQKVGDVDLVWTKVVFTENFPNTITFESQTGSSIFSNYFESEMFQTWSIRGQKICFPRTRIHSFLYPAKPQPAVYIAGYKKCHFVQIATLIWLLLALFPRTAEYTNICEQKKMQIDL